MMVLALATSVVLLALSLLHVYWAAGGRRGIDAVIPTQGGRRTLTPSRLATLTVAAALAVAALIAVGATGMLGAVAPEWLIRTGLVVLAAVFGLRAVGDFRLIGFTKRVKGTRFARLDTRVFSPLCVGLAVACAALAWFSNGVAP
jgi:uncharacterized protein DUF3995